MTLQRKAKLGYINTRNMINTGLRKKKVLGHRFPKCPNSRQFGIDDYSATHSAHSSMWQSREQGKQQRNTRDRMGWSEPPAGQMENLGRRRTEWDKILTVYFSFQCPDYIRCIFTVYYNSCVQQLNTQKLRAPYGRHEKSDYVLQKRNVWHFIFMHQTMKKSFLWRKLIKDLPCWARSYPPWKITWDNTNSYQSLANVLVKM